MSSDELLFLKIQVFYSKFLAGAFDQPVDLAKALEALADEAWNEVERLYPPSLRIDP